MPVDATQLVSRQRELAEQVFHVGGGSWGCAPASGLTAQEATGFDSLYLCTILHSCLVGL